MPQLVRLYIRNVVIGFGIAALFSAMLVWLDAGGLRHLIFQTDLGWVAALMLVLANGTLFAGVQFAIAVMLMAEDDDEPRGGRRQRVARAPVLLPIPVRDRPMTQRHRR
ncbi:MAG: hypothetical protein KGN33_10895 [Paracoccaceae bacterium]|nr:hypothetical protein [Paracoccaceae bacterium]